MQALKKYRGQEKGFADLLNYAAVIDDGVILNKDGSLMAAWYYRGRDLATVSDSERNRISTHINAAFMRFGSEWCLHQDAIRVESREYPQPDESHFPDLVTRLIVKNAECVMKWRQRTTKISNVLTLTYLPEKSSQAKFGEMMFDDYNKQRTNAAEVALRHFNTAITDFTDRLSSIVSLYRLKGETYTDEFGQEHIHDRFLSYLHQVITGDNYPINLPDCAMYLDAVIGAQEFYTGMIPKINDKFIQVVTIEGFPAESTRAFCLLLTISRAVTAGIPALSSRTLWMVTPHSMPIVANGNNRYAGSSIKSSSPSIQRRIPGGSTRMRKRWSAKQMWRCLRTLPAWCPMATTPQPLS